MNRIKKFYNRLRERLVERIDKMDFKLLNSIVVFCVLALFVFAVWKLFVNAYFLFRDVPEPQRTEQSVQTPVPDDIKPIIK